MIGPKLLLKRKKTKKKYSLGILITLSRPVENFIII
jgi:hypothetical protein